jgi:hypothetical protein
MDFSNAQTNQPIGNNVHPLESTAQTNQSISNNANHMRPFESTAQMNQSINYNANYMRPFESTAQVNQPISNNANFMHPFTYGNVFSHGIIFVSYFRNFSNFLIFMPNSHSRSITNFWSKAPNP